MLIPKTNAGPGSGNQSGDEMAFMCWYNLLRYERDPQLRSIYGWALRQRWEMERFELNPLFNFIAAASLEGIESDERLVDHWNHDPWRLDQGGDGRYLADGAAFLLPYYMGRYHKYVVE